MSSTQKTCFVISPIGPDESSVREAANDFLELLVEPALEKYGFLVTRADRIAHPTAITTDIVRLVQESDLCLIDLTNSNPNVFYECGRRHETGKPFIQMIAKGHEGSLPFDVAGIRTVVYDVDSPRAARDSVLKLQEFIDALLTGGFESTTSGDSLSSIALGIERIERKINQLLSAGNVTSQGDGVLTDVRDLLKKPTELFMELLQKGQPDRAFPLLDRIKKMSKPTQYVELLVLLVSMGHGKAFELMDGELHDLLAKPIGDTDSEMLQLMAEGFKRYFENAGQLKDGIKYLQELYANVVSIGKFTDEGKAYIANKVGMLAWAADDSGLCIKYSKFAVSLYEDPSYLYNLALAYMQQKMDLELRDTLKHLMRLPDLDSDHISLLKRNGYQYSS